MIGPAVMGLTASPGRAILSFCIGGLSFSLVIGASADTIGFNPLFVCLAIVDLFGASVLWTPLRRSPTVQRNAA